MTTGSPLEGSQRSEVIDLYDASVACNDFPPFPKRINAANGGLLNNNDIFICGGTFQVNCYVLGTEGPQASMLQERHSPGSHVLANNTLFSISGGVKTTELVSSGQASTVGPEPPTDSSGICITAVNDSLILQTGGENSSNKSYFFDIDKNKWYEGPDMPHGKYYHACGTFKSAGHSQRTVAIVAGGQNIFYLNSTYILDIDNQKWEKGMDQYYNRYFKFLHFSILGPNLPLKIQDGKILSSPSGQGAIFIGGKSEMGHHAEMYKLTFNVKAGSFEWFLMEQHLNIPRGEFVAMYIPNEITNCTKIAH